MTASGMSIVHRPSDDHPGWHSWDVADDARFNAVVIGKLIVRQEDDRTARVRMLKTDIRHSNLQNNLHGAVTLSLIDIGLFATIFTVLGADTSAAVTLDVHSQFIGSGRIGEPLDLVGEVVKETGRLVFLRGIVEQEHGPIASFMGTIRKPTRR